jgi:hypothetical protein
VVGQAVAMAGAFLSFDRHGRMELGCRRAAIVSFPTLVLRPIPMTALSLSSMMCAPINEARQNADNCIICSFEVGITEQIGLLTTS